MQWIDLLMRLHYFVQGKSCKRSSMIRPDRSISYPFHGATLLQHKISTWLFQLPSLSCLRKRLESDVSDQNNSLDPQQWIESQAYVPLHAIQYISRAWSIGPFLQFIKLLCVALNNIPPTPPQSARVIPSWLMCRRALIDLICRVQSFFIYPCIDLLIEFPAAYPGDPYMTAFMLAWTPHDLFEAAVSWLLRWIFLSGASMALWAF